MSQRTLVVGGGGFIGRHLVARLLADGSDVDVLVRPTTDIRPLVEQGGIFSIHRADLADETALAAVLGQVQPTRVFHLAMCCRRARDPGLLDVRSALAEDVGGLVALLAALAGLPRPPEVMVRAGSLAEYGPIAVPYREDAREAPANSYALAALAGTQVATMLQDRLPFALTTARLALVYGPGQAPDFLIPALIRELGAGRPVHVARPGDRRDLLHVDDAVDGLVALAASPVAPVVNICSGTGQGVAEVAHAVARELGADPSLLTLGPRNASGGTPDLLGSPALAAERLRWRARIAFDDGLRRTVAAARETVPC